MDRRQRLFRNRIGLDRGRMKRLAAIGVMLLAVAPRLCADEIPAAARRSGFTFMSPETQAIQNDDTSNPGMLWVKDGEALWNGKVGAAQKSCADCHGDVSGLRGVAARYPAFDPGQGRPIDLAQRVNLCRIAHQQA